MAEPPPLPDDAPGILYYDPNPTTAKLATAGLRLGGFEVFAASRKDDAVSMCESHGPGGSGDIVAILLDASAHPKASASVLKALVKLPGANQLPGILLVSRNNPTPIPGAEALPTLSRPFSTPGLVRAVRDALDEDRPLRELGERHSDLGQRRLRELMAQHFPGTELDDAAVRGFATALRGEQRAPDPPAGVAMQGDLEGTKLEAVLEMLGEEGVRGVLTMSGQDDRWGRLHLDRGRIRLAEIRGSDEDLKLGRFVVSGGFMADEELEAFVVGRDPQGRPLGQRLVDEGFLTSTDLAAVLVSQAREVTCHLLTWSSGAFVFEHTDELHPLAQMASEGKAELLVAEALLDGLRRIDERAEMGPHMPQVDDVFMRIDEQLARIGRHALAREELAVLELLNGRNSVKEIARKTRTGSFSVARIIHRLTKANLARRRVMPVTV